MDVDVPYWYWAALGEGGSTRPALTAFAGSPGAQTSLATAIGDPDPWLTRLVAANPDVRVMGDPVLAVWADDPLSLGCYSSWSDSAIERAPLFRGTIGRMVFAGEHTAGAHSGTMNGAVLSGTRAAAQILETSLS